MKYLDSEFRAGKGLLMTQGLVKSLKFFWGILLREAGIHMPFRRIGSLEATLPMLQKHLVLTSLISYLLFAGVSTALIAFSNLKM